MAKEIPQEIDVEKSADVDVDGMILETDVDGDFKQCYSARNNFERFRFFLDLIGRFEFDLRRRGFFLNDSNFWCVRGSITHNVVHGHVL